jgi:hypothetical protein
MAFDILSGLLGVGATGALANYGVREAEQAGTAAANQLTGLAGQLQNQLQFKPYTVTTGTGTTTATPTGLSLETSPQMQALQQQLLSGAGTLFGAAAAPVQDRATAITQMLEAAAAPSRTREYLALENRLFQQGRGGVQTAQYGSTPEMLAFAKALEEQRAQNALLGRQQAVAEQAQAYNVGQGMFGQSFLPQTQALAFLQGAAPSMELAARRQTQQAVTGAELQQAAAEAQLQAAQQANVLRQTYLQQVLQGLFAPSYSVNDGNVTTGSSLIGGLLESLFNRNTNTVPAG